MYLTQQVSIKKKFSDTWEWKNGFQELMADDDEVFEVTAISEQLDLRREVCTNKNVFETLFKIKGRGKYAFDGLQLLTVPVFLHRSRSIATIASFWQDNYENIFTHFGIY